MSLGVRSKETSGLLGLRSSPAHQEITFGLNSQVVNRVGVFFGLALALLQISPSGTSCSRGVLSWVLVFGDLKSSPPLSPFLPVTRLIKSQDNLYFSSVCESHSSILAKVCLSGWKKVTSETLFSYSYNAKSFTRLIRAAGTTSSSHFRGHA